MTDAEIEAAARALAGMQFDDVEHEWEQWIPEARAALTAAAAVRAPVEPVGWREAAQKPRRVHRQQGLVERVRRLSSRLSPASLSPARWRAMSITGIIIAALVVLFAVWAIFAKDSHSG